MWATCYFNHVSGPFQAMHCSCMLIVAACSSWLHAYLSVLAAASLLHAHCSVLAALRRWLHPYKLGGVTGGLTMVGGLDRLGGVAAVARGLTKVGGLDKLGGVAAVTGGLAKAGGLDKLGGIAAVAGGIKLQVEFASSNGNGARGG